MLQSKPVKHQQKEANCKVLLSTYAEGKRLSWSRDSVPSPSTLGLAHFLHPQTASVISSREEIGPGLPRPFSASLPDGEGRQPWVPSNLGLCPRSSLAKNWCEVVTVFHKIAMQTLIQKNPFYISCQSHLLGMPSKSDTLGKGTMFIWNSAKALVL